jgi:hypothetical protein
VGDTSYSYCNGDERVRFPSFIFEHVLKWVVFILFLCGDGGGKSILVGCKFDEVYDIWWGWT